MKMMIPMLGSRIRLRTDWSFDLYYESRNESVYELFNAFTHLKGIGGCYLPSWRLNDADKEPVQATLPAGTLLTIDRYYIRQGAADFDSVTFMLPSQPLPGYAFGKKRSARFWVKLEDVNEIDFEFLEEDQPWWHGVKDKLKAGNTVKVNPNFAFLYNRSEVELHPLTVNKRDELPTNIEFFVIAEGSRVAFVRLVDDVPCWAADDTRFSGRRNASASMYSTTFYVSTIIGYVVKP
jgi:hypothetical protein